MMTTFRCIFGYIVVGCVLAGHYSVFGDDGDDSVCVCIVGVLWPLYVCWLAMHSIYSYSVKLFEGFKR